MTVQHGPLVQEQMVRAMVESDRTFDGRFIVGVLTTGIYCLPSCHPPRKPNPENVRFFSDPEAARSAGLRPCKLCRPDDYYRGHFAEEALIEATMLALQRDPGEFRQVRALEQSAGVGTSKLHELFRTYYHTTPAEALARARVVRARQLLLQGELPIAEIAFAVGFGSLSAFNENFRAYSAMTPAAYRALAAGGDFTLVLPPDYPLTWMLHYLGRDAHSLTERREGNTYTAVFNLTTIEGEVQPVLVQAQLAPGAAQCHVSAPASLSAPEMGQVHERLLGALGLATDPARFVAQINAVPTLAPLVAGLPGLRIPLIIDPFDAVVRTITGQQITLGFAAQLRRRLVEHFSAPVGDGLYAPPSAVTLAALSVPQLAALSFSRSKATYLIGAAVAALDGRLPLGNATARSAPAIERALLAIHGIGAWSAHYVMLRGMGLLDCVPLGDTGLTAGLQHFFSLAERPGREATLALMEHFRPFRSLATFHLWRLFGAQRAHNQEVA